MKVLFVYSGNKKMSGPVKENQAESLCEAGVEVDHFIINGRGIVGYLSNIPKLRRKTKENQYDIIHAHYSLSALVATLSGAHPLIVSLMGSDINSRRISRVIIRIFVRLFWDSCIVKCEQMKKILNVNTVEVIPNGVNLSHFITQDSLVAKKNLNWDPGKKHILFGANPLRYEKNYDLFLKAVELLNLSEIEIHLFQNVPHKEVPEMLNASDTVVLTSRWEGSPNVIKEAMACNRPVVSTDVGDVRYLFGSEPGYFISDPHPSDIAENIIHAFQFAENSGSTNGRKRIIDLGLDSVSIANRITKTYSKIIGNCV